MIHFRNNCNDLTAFFLLFMYETILNSGRDILLISSLTPMFIYY